VNTALGRTLKHSPMVAWHPDRHAFCLSLREESALVTHRLKHTSCER
jgi:hypothetical protein